MKQLCYISVTFSRFNMRVAASMTLSRHDSPQFCIKILFDSNKNIFEFGWFNEIINHDLFENVWRFDFLLLHLHQENIKITDYGKKV